MRTTMQSLYRLTLADLNISTNAIAKLNTQISSGRIFSKLSDEPDNLVSALSYRTNLSEIRQYQENLTYGNSLITGAESALTEMKGLVSRAKILNIQAIDGALNTENRSLIAEEISSLYEEAIALSNTQISGKFIFGGYRTTGYDDIEPTPFMKDFVDGHRINGVDGSPINGSLTSGPILNAANLLAGDLLINGEDMGAVDLTSFGLTNGLNMGGGFQLVNAINTNSTSATATLTTLSAGAAAAAGTATTVSFNLNDVFITFTTSATPAADAINAINARTSDTGVQAILGDGTNGGTAGSVVLRNIQDGDDNNIVITNFTGGAGTASTGLGNVNQAADPTHNTGTASIQSTGTYLDITTSAADDTILALVGLGGGGNGFGDEAGDGAIVFAPQLADGALSINGIPIAAPVSDGISTIYSDVSALAKANTINNVSTITGVRAVAVPFSRFSTGNVFGGTEESLLTGTVTNNGIAATDLAINGISIGAIAGGAVQDGLNMEKAYNARAAINVQSGTTGVTAHLTTLSAGAAATAGTTTTVSFDLNNVAISFDTDVNPASDAVDAINAVADQTGILAFVGTGTNGGAAGAVVLKNVVPGDESNIVISNYDGGIGTASTGLGNINQAADATHNAGQISLSSSQSFTLASPNESPPSDAVLNELGLGGGEAVTGAASDFGNDGRINYGSTPSFIGPGDLIINGVDIFTSPKAILSGDSTNALIDTINDQSANTGVRATRNASGNILIAAVDGRNVHVQTSTNGETITRLNGSSPPVAQSVVYFGSIQLKSDRRFELSSAPTANYEPALAALGMAGGSAVTGEPGDISGDGIIVAESLIAQEGSVRYTGDRVNDVNVKVGRRTTMEVTKNGQDVLMDISTFSALKKLENVLRGQGFTEALGNETASITSAIFNTGDTGLEFYEDLTSGSFTVTVTNHETNPASLFTIDIPVDPAIDTPDEVAEKISAVPGITAMWGADGRLSITSDNPERYTFSLTNDTSNFLKVAGVTHEEVQVYSLEQSLSDLETLMTDLTREISDFGARANRIVVQEEIYMNLELSTEENLSEQQDTDLVEALMQMKNKEVAYQAALSSASKMMQMSLVNFL